MRNTRFPWITLDDFAHFFLCGRCGCTVKLTPGAITSGNAKDEADEFVDKHKLCQA